MPQPTRLQNLRTILSTALKLARDDSDEVVALEEAQQLIEDDIATHGCHGDCFGLRSIVDTVEAQQSYTGEQLSPFMAPVKCSGLSKAPAVNLYQPLALGQTRLLRIAPADHNETLLIDLVVGEVTAVPGIRLINQRTTVRYTALSYCWHSPGTSTVIRCNNIDVPVSSNVFAAIKHHQREADTVYLWIDALCIDQSNVKEKEMQVPMMLDIYMKAEQTTAWLGQADADSSLAFTCLTDHAQELHKLNAQENKQVVHSADCQGPLRTVFLALVGLYERPYLSRTWIRQETYISRELTVVCGREIPWSVYLSGREWLDALETHILIQGDLRSRLDRIHALLRDAKTTLDTWRCLGSATPRNPFQVLRRSAYYGVTEENDTVYAVLRMCGIPSISRSHSGGSQDEGIVIDYGRSAADTYHELTKYLVRFTPPRQCCRLLWPYHIQRLQPEYPGHHEPGYDTPSWSVDWRASRCSHKDLITIASIKRSDDETSEQIRQMTARSETLIMARPPNLWCTQWALTTQGITGSSIYRTIHAFQIQETNLEQPRPRISPQDHRVLELSGRAINYVAYISEFSCSLDTFVMLTPGEVLGRAAKTIHTQGAPLEGHKLFRINPESVFERFDKTRHVRKVAILGLGLDAQLALVPWTAKKGDVVVAIGPTLPMLLTAVNGHSPCDQLYSVPDHYAEHIWDDEEAKASPKDDWYTPYLHPAASANSVGGVRRILLPGILLIFLGIPSMVAGSVYVTIKTGSDGAGLAVIYVPMLLGVCWLLWTSRSPSSSSSRLNPVVRQCISKQLHNFEHLDCITELTTADYRLQGPVFAPQLGIWRELYYPTPIRPASPFVHDRPVQRFFVH